MKEEDELTTPIKISNTPSEIILDNLEINQGECSINSYRVAKQYPTIDIIEGLIIVYDNTGGAKAMPHVWNKKENTHFDVTNEKIWAGKEIMDETTDIKYFIVKIHNSNDFKDGDKFEFCLETRLNVDAINSRLS